MKLNNDDYTVVAAANGGFYACFMDSTLCCAFGNTPDEACANLEQTVDEYIGEMFMVEEYI